MSSDVKLKTITAFINDPNTERILSHMTKIAKNVYNSTIYCMTIFLRYKEEIFKEIYEEIKDETFNSNYDKTILEKKFYNLYEKKYNDYSKIISLVKVNNEIIYKFIKSALIGIELNNDNYSFLKYYVAHNVFKNKNIIYDENNKKEVVLDLIDNILKSRYIKNYFRIKNQLKNKIPIKNTSDILINQVKKGKFLFKKEKVSWKKKIEEKLPLNEEGKKTKLVSNNNIVSRVTYKHLGDNKDKLPSQVIIDTIQKAYNGYESFYSLRNKGIKANMPKYLDKNGHYNLPFVKRASIKIVNNNGQMYARLTIGEYVADNYINITMNKDLICLNGIDAKYKQYVSKHKLIPLTTPVNIKMNYVISFDETVKGNEVKKSYYIPKNNKHIIDAYYIYLKLPHNILKTDIRTIEIVPLYENHSYKACFTYKPLIIPKKKELNKKITENDSISIDLGMISLMTIYNPTGFQKIISGKYLIWLNNSYNHKIDKLKSQAKKLNGKDTTKQIRDLLIERDNKINNHFNKIITWMTKEYPNKKLIIIGYNTNWKKGVNMGKETNRKFYQIPYCRLLNKLKDKMMQLGIEVVINEESYTSKCDGLALEEVCKHDKYLGKRLKRGLFKSSVGKLINADLNGAINIMRKYFLTKGYKMPQVNGLNLYNPIRANIHRDAVHKPVV